MAVKDQKVTPNVVPQTFSPKPEDYAPQVTQELRSQQAHWARDFTINFIDNLKNIRRQAWYQRPENWRFRSEAESNAKLDQRIKAAKTAQTVMMDRISEWAGAHNKEVFLGMLPDVFNKFFIAAQGEPAPKAEEPTTEEPEEEPVALVVDLGSVEDEEEEAPEAIQVINRPEIDPNAPKSKVKPPPEPKLGDVLAKAEADNKDG